MHPGGLLRPSEIQLSRRGQAQSKLSASSRFSLTRQDASFQHQGLSYASSRSSPPLQDTSPQQQCLFSASCRPFPPLRDTAGQAWAGAKQAGCILQGFSYPSGCIFSTSRLVLRIFHAPDTSPGSRHPITARRKASWVHPAGFLHTSRIQAPNHRQAQSKLGSSWRPSPHLQDTGTQSPPGAKQAERILQAFSAPPGYSRPGASFYSAIIFPSANALLHSSGNTVSCRTFFTSGSKRVQGQSVLL